MTATLIAAHRGATDSARENTRDAFARALELGADLIELDVRKSFDGVLLVHHDGFVTQGDHEYQIKELDYHMLNSLVDYQVPRLEDVLIEFGGRIRFDLELKETGYEEFFLDSVLAHLAPDRFVCTSFHDSSVAKLKSDNRAVRVGLLLGIKEPTNVFTAQLSELFPWQRHQRCGADFLAPHYGLASFWFIKTAAAKRIPLYIWTVNQPHLIKRFCHWQVEAVISDRLEQALTIRDQIKRQNT